MDSHPAALLASLTTPSPLFFKRFMYGMLASMTMFITAYEKMDKEKDMFHEKTSDHGEIFDFIIVGGGTAGSILANRLSENFKVLLLEAGGDPFPLQNVPGLTPFMANNKAVDWMHRTTKQTRACLALNNQTAAISQGKGLGGTSNLNHLMHLRGSPFDFNAWTQKTNDSSLNYQQLLKYFKKHENYEAIWRDGLIHGFNGEVHIEIPDFTGLGSRFIDAAQELGYNQTDLNGLYAEGFDYVTSPIKRGYRDATYNAFLKKLRNRRSLIIRKYAHVNKVLIEKSKMSAFGVKYRRFRKSKMAFATKEVILSAGAVQSAKILMLSGLGPKDDLENLGIKMLADLPVGQNIQDHLTTHVGPFITSGKGFLIDRDISGLSVAQFGSFNGKGPLTSAGIHGNGLICSQKAKLANQMYWPDLLITLMGFSHHKTYSSDFSKIYNFNESIASKFFKQAQGKDSFTIGVTLTRPESKGFIKLRDRNPFSSVIIDPKYLHEPKDLMALVDGVRKTLDLVGSTRAFKSVGAQIDKTMFPECGDFSYGTFKYWQCYVTHFTMSGNSLVSSCPMGLPGQNDSVVDPEFRVLGVSRLRVIDASVFPTIISSPIQAAVMMMAEKGADYVQQYWGIHTNV